MKRITKTNEYAIIITAYGLTIDTIKEMTETDIYQQDKLTNLGVLLLGNLRKIIDKNDNLTIKALIIIDKGKHEIKGYTRVNKLVAALEMITTHEDIEKTRFNIGLQEHIPTMKNLVYEDLDPEVIAQSKEYGYALTSAIRRN